MMPTAARLVAALAFALVAWMTAELYKPGLPPETQWGQFSVIAAIVGLLVGWQVMGSRVGRGNRAAMGYGLRTAVTIVILVLLIFSIREMLGQTMRRRYDGVFDAVMGVLDFVIAYGRELWHPEPLSTLVVGSLLGGLLAEWAGRKWR